MGSCCGVVVYMGHVDMCRTDDLSKSCVTQVGDTASLSLSYPSRALATRAYIFLCLAISLCNVHPPARTCISCPGQHRPVVAPWLMAAEPPLPLRYLTRNPAVAWEGEFENFIIRLSIQL